MRIFASLVIALMLAAPVRAQDSFKQIWVTQADSGEIVRGRLVTLSSESLSILTPDNRRIDVPIDRVLRIEARGDSLKNGAAIGAAIMAGLSVIGCQGFNGGGACVTAAAFNIGFGALIGAGVDALNAGRSTLYARPAAAKPGARVQLKLKW